MRAEPGRRALRSVVALLVVLLAVPGVAGCGADESAGARTATTARSAPERGGTAAPDDGAPAATDAALARLASDGVTCEAAVRRDGAEVHAASAGEEAVGAVETSAVTASLVAVTVVVLAERGVLALDGDVHTWLPELPRGWGGLTLTHLLDQSSGIRDHRELVGEGATDGDVLAALAAEPGLDFAPGAQRVVNPSNAFLLALVVERATGQPFPEVVGQLVLEPVGMAATSLDAGTNGSQPVRTTAGDLARWADELRTGSALGPAATSAVQQPPTGAADERSGTRRRTDGQGRQAVAATDVDGPLVASATTWPGHELSVGIACRSAGATVTSEAVDGLADELAEAWLR